MMRGSMDRVRKKRARGMDKATNNEPEQQSDMINCNTSGLDILKSDSGKGSSRREKIKPIRSCLKSTQSQVKPPDKVAESNMDMDNMSLKDMLRFLDEEEALLLRLQSKMSEEISRLQVEEHVFLHTLKIFDEEHDGPSNKINEDQQRSSSDNQEFIDALNVALMDNAESKADNLDKSKETCD